MASPQLPRSRRPYVTLTLVLSYIIQIVSCGGFVISTGFYLFLIAAFQEKTSGVYIWCVATLAYLVYSPLICRLQSRRLDSVRRLWGCLSGVDWR